MSLEPIVNLGSKYVNGCKGVWVSNTVRTILPGQLRDSTNTFDIVVPSALLVTSTFVGAGGLDTGTIAPSTFYAIYVLFDPTNNIPPALVLSTSFSGPIMPSVDGVTYSAFRLIDVTQTDSSSHFKLDYNFSTNSSIIYKQMDVVSTVLSGNATSITNVDLSPFVPPINFGRITFSYIFTPLSASDRANVYNVGSTNIWQTFTGQVATVRVTGQFQMLPQLSSGFPNIAYNVGDSGDLFALAVAGFEFFI